MVKMRMEIKLIQSYVNNYELMLLHILSLASIDHVHSPVGGSVVWPVDTVGGNVVRQFISKTLSLFFSVSEITVILSSAPSRTNMMPSLSFLQAFIITSWRCVVDG